MDDSDELTAIQSGPPELTPEILEQLERTISNVPDDASRQAFQTVVSIVQRDTQRYADSPLPKPSTMEGYRELMPNLPERLVVAYEKEIAHRHQTEVLELEHERTDDHEELELMRLRTKLSFAILALMLVLSTALFLANKGTAGVGVFLSTALLASAALVKQLRDE